MKEDDKKSWTTSSRDGLLFKGARMSRLDRVPNEEVSRRTEATKAIIVRIKANDLKWFDIY